MSAPKKILADTIKILSFHRSIGLEEIPLSKGLRDFLSHPLRTSPPPAPHKTEVETTGSATSRTLRDLRIELGDCTRCSLHQGRTSILFGSGSEKARLFIVGAWPNRLDDQSGRIFSDEEGEMLDKMLTHVLKLGQDEVYLSSIIKCRVPEDAQPDLIQVRTCTPFLLNQLAVVQPKIICTMGQLAAQTLLKTREPLIKLRGRFHEINGIPLMPTFHPSYLIKTPEMKQAALRDLQMIRERLDL